MRTWTFHSADGLVFGREAVRQLPDVARRLKAKRVFVVTDKVLESAGVAARVRGELAADELTVESLHVDTPEPAAETARAAAASPQALHPQVRPGPGGGS